MGIILGKGAKNVYEFRTISKSETKMSLKNVYTND